MKLNALFALAALAFAFTAGGAEARPNDGSMWSHAYEQGSVTKNRARTASRSKVRAERADRGYRRTYTVSSGGRGVGPRPARWCGWWMRTQLGGGPEYNLAANWRRYGRAGSPQIGAVVVWPHHVGMITGRAANGQWIVTSGNDGGRVRSRARSIAGATIRV